MAEGRTNTLEDDRFEYFSLRKSVEFMERLINDPKTADTTRDRLSTWVSNVSLRIGMLQELIEGAESDKEEEDRREALVTAMIREEIKLNAAEQKEFGGFLKKDFFTKNDFAQLESFYKQAWSRLSENGKDEMSHRIWEGIRNDQYMFSELPKAVRERETDQVYACFKDSDKKFRNLIEVPEADRKDFVEAYENGKHLDAEHILNRENFRKGMFRARASEVAPHEAVVNSREVDRAQVGQGAAESTTKEAGAQSKAGSDKCADLDLSEVSLNGIKMVEPPARVSAVGVPDSGSGKSTDTPSVPGH